MFITPECLDPDLAAPFIDVDEQRTVVDPATDATLNYRYVHGGFTDTDARFSFYFPTAGSVPGAVLPRHLSDGVARGRGRDTIVFALTNGAYVVSSNNAGGVSASPALGGYRVNAAAAKFSRSDRTAGVWRGCARAGLSLRRQRRCVPGASAAWRARRACGTARCPWCPGRRTRSRASRVRWCSGCVCSAISSPAIVDALEPGGSGDPYAGLSDEQAAFSTR